MGSSRRPKETLAKELSLTRRGFIASTAALGATTALYGCSKDDGGEIIFTGGGLLILSHL